MVNATGWLREGDGVIYRRVVMKRLLLSSSNVTPRAVYVTHLLFNLMFGQMEPERELVIRN